MAPARRMRDLGSGDSVPSSLMARLGFGLPMAFPRLWRPQFSEHLAALGIDDDGTVHVGIEIDCLARLAHVMSGELRHHGGAAEREGNEGTCAGGLHQLDLDRKPRRAAAGKL